MAKKATTPVHHACPKYSALLPHVPVALKNLGGSGSNDEIRDEVIRLAKLPEKIVDEMHSFTMTELEYQLAWARTHLKNAGYITSGRRTIWALTALGNEAVAAGPIDVKKVKELERERARACAPEEVAESSEPFDDLRPWKERLGEVLLAMDPFAFERLAQRLLRECGFSEVNVTKKSGDGGIDGTGKLRINGIFSFNVAFQCKRYKDAVGAPEIRNFRGSLSTNIEKGIFITTSAFTAAAKEEASCPGKQQVDLMDGDDFMEKLAEYGIGLREVKDYEIDEAFFQKI